MKKRVLLLRPNHTNDRKDHYISFPSGLAYIAAVVREAGHEVRVIDLTLRDVDYEALRRDIEEFRPDVFALGALSHAFPHTRRLTSFLKDARDIPVILGGHLATHNPREILKNTKVDICVLGEGELTIVDLLDNLETPEKVKGVAYVAADGEVVKTGARELIQNLDTLPMPAYDLFEMDVYLKMRNVYVSQRNMPDNKPVRRRISIEAGRGCPFACNYCSRIHRSIRKRSIDHLMAEIDYLIKTYDIDLVRFQDELFFFDHDYVKEFCRRIMPYNVGWSGNARIDTIERDLIKHIAKHHCTSISFGVESGSREILRRMNKKITPEQIHETLTACLDEGLPISVNLILGYHGENQKSVDDTVELLKRIGFPGVKFHYITPYPGSPLYEEAKAAGLITDEVAYLESLGDGTGPYKFRFNLTEFTNEELRDLLPITAKRVMRNYLAHLLLHPRKLLRYLRYKDIMNPVWYYYNRWLRPTNYDKAAKLKA